MTDDLLSRVDRLKEGSAADQAERAARAAQAREQALADDPTSARWLESMRQVFAGSIFKGFVHGYAERRPDVFNMPGGPPEEIAHERRRFKR